ncbi:MAG: hypothetical protein IJC68_02570 [Firmicutes bacterium]|nr:hypothetical protein [Bacillota bacterium]
MADDDCFCTRCGTPVRRPAEEQAPARPSAAAYNPEFTWNVQEFPAEPRKTADIDFQWGPAQGAQGRRAYVVDERRPLFFSTGESYGAPEEPRPRPAYADPLAGENPWQQKGLYQTSPETQTFRRSKVQTMEIPAAKPEEPAAPAYEAPAAPVYETPAAPAAEEPITGHRLEEELFREMEESTRQARERHEEKFYTFSKKNEEFQRLLDREYEKIRRNGTPAERPANFFSLDEDPIPASLREDFEPVSAPEEPVKPAPKSAKAAEKAKAAEPMTIWEEIRADLEREAAAREAAEQAGAKSAAAEPAKESAAAAGTAAGIAAAKETAAAEPAGDPAVKASEETALAQTLPPLWFELEDDEEPEKKGIFWKVLLGVLIFLLLLVGAAFAVKQFLPDSGAAELVTSAENVILEIWNTLFGE